MREGGGGGDRRRARCEREAGAADLERVRRGQSAARSGSTAQRPLRRRNSRACRAWAPGVRHPSRTGLRMPAAAHPSRRPGSGARVRPACGCRRPRTRHHRPGSSARAGPACGWRREQPRRPVKGRGDGRPSPGAPGATRSEHVLQSEQLAPPRLGRRSQAPEFDPPTGDGGSNPGGLRRATTTAIPH